MYIVEYNDLTSDKPREVHKAECERQSDVDMMYFYDAGGVIRIINHYEEDKKVNIKIMSDGWDKTKTYKKVCFTGHRPDKLGGYKNPDSALRTVVRKRLHDACDYLVLNCGTEAFMTGMAQGIDQDAAEEVLSIINQMANESDGTTYVTLYAAVPYPGQASVWPDAAQKKYRNLLRSIEILNPMENHVQYVHEDKPTNKRDAVVWLDERNHYMVDWCDLVVAVWDGTPGGTKNCIDYAKRVGKPILLLYIER